MRFLVPLILICFISVKAQQVDLVRLGYDEKKLRSTQLGLAVSGDGKFVAFLFKDKTIKIYDVHAGRFVNKFVAPIENMNERDIEIRLTNDERIILVSGTVIKVFDSKSGKFIRSILVVESCDGKNLTSSFSSAHNILALSNACGIITVWDLNKYELIKRIEARKPLHWVQAAFPSISLSPDGKRIAVAENKYLSVYDILTGRVALEKKYNGGYLGAGGVVMAAYDDTGENIFATVQVVEAYTGGYFYIESTRASDLSEVRHFERIAIASGRGIISAICYKNRLLGLSSSRSFDIYDTSTGNVTFSTKREKGTTIFRKFFDDNKYIFPLGQGKFLLNCSQNNINQIYNASSNSITGYFFADSNDDYAIVSRDGRVDGNQDTFSKVYWTSRKSSQKTSLDSRFEKGFTPKLLALLVQDANSVETAEFDADDAIGKTPVLTIKSINGNLLNSSAAISATQKIVSIEVSAIQNATEVTEVRLYQNGKLQKTKANEGLGVYSFTAHLSNAFGEENYFFVSAQSKSGTESEKVKFIVKYKGATDEKPKLFLVTIGVNQYRNPKYNLNYAQADADSAESNFKMSTTDLFQEVVVFKIRNENATKESILSAMREVGQRALEQDVLLFYYAGHGVMNGDEAEVREFYIVPYDVTQLYGKDEMLKEKAISASELKNTAQNINAQKQVFILDACQSAGALEAVAYRGAAEEKAIAQLARSTGTFWITSTGTEQFASEFEKLGHGVFTNALLQGIAGKADANGDKKLTVRELSTYIENKVPELSEELKGTPQFPSAYSFGNDFPIAIYKK